MNIQQPTPMTPLRARMIVDMTGRNLGPASQTSHLRACKRFAAYRLKGAGRHTSMTLTTPEFIRRFLIHVLPKGQHRIRHYGFYGNGNRAANIARIRHLLGATSSDQCHANDDSLGDNDEPPRVLALPCPCCGGRLIIVETIAPTQHPRAPPRSQRAAA